MNRLHTLRNAIFTSLLILLLIAPAGCADKPGAEQAAAPRGPVLIMVHPTESTVRDIAALAERGLLDVPGLRVVGVYHEKESTDFSGARELLESNNIDWFTIREISCKLGSKTVYEINDCTPEFKKLFRESDAVLFTGGMDIQPSLYHEKKNPLTAVATPRRHIFEASFLFHLLGGPRNPDFEPLLAQRPGYAVFGICLGMQTMNVAAGGTLVQDIPSVLYPDTDFDTLAAENPHALHRAQSGGLLPGSSSALGVLHGIAFADEWSDAPELPDGDGPPLVLSIHHQAVDHLAPNLSILATSLDGRVVEMLGHDEFPNVIGVQFHPEKRVLWDADRNYQSDLYPGEDNFAAGAMQRDQRTRAFHKWLWRDWSQKILDSHAAGG